MRVTALDGVLRSAWSSETSADPDGWTPDRPSHGQCVVTALVIQDLLGGYLMRAEVNGISHYWNSVDGNDIDLTWDQFDQPVHRTPAEWRTREYVLSFAFTRLRYDLLRLRIAELLAEAPAHIDERDAR